MSTWRAAVEIGRQAAGRRDQSSTQAVKGRGRAEGAAAFPLDTGNPPGCATEIRRRRRGRIAAFSHVAAYRDGTSIVGVGVWLAGRGLQAVLFQVPAFHAATIGTTAAVLAAIALAACLVPSRRAARLSPVEAMINE